MASPTHAELAEWLDKLLETRPADRPDVARSISGLDQKLYKKLMSLVCYSQEEDQFDPNPIVIGNTVGVYRLQSLLGAGGMGTVYIADRCDGVIEQQVAIKFSAVELPSTYRQRFEGERQFLANLGHPNVVNFIDAGIYRDEYPYLVMEYVNGVPVDDYVQAHGVSVSEALSLFRDLCSACAYCHQQLFVHGDIKPGNAIINNEGSLKLLDFGLAQLIGENTHSIKRGVLAATLGYTAPEQLRRESPDARADVFSLGKVLDRLLDVIGESGCLVSSARAVANKAAALEKVQRYDSVGDLLEDLNRLQMSLPIEAMGARWTYRCRLFLKRNWMPLSAVSFSGLVLVSALTVVFFLYQNSQHDALRAQQALQFLTGLFERASPWDAGVRDPTVAELVDEAAQRIDIELQGAPAVRGEMQKLLGRAYSGLGDDVKALEFYGAAESTIRETTPNNLEKLTEIQVQIAVELAGQGHKQTSIEILRAAIAKYESLGLALSVGAADAWLALGGVMYDEAERPDAYRNYLSIHKDLKLSDSPTLASALSGLGSALQHQGRYQEALQLIQQSLEVLEQLGFRRSPDGVLARDTLAIANWYVGNHGQARLLHEEALTLAEERLGKSHPALIAPLSNLGHLYQRLGQLEDARRLLERANKLALEQTAPLHFPRIAAEINLAKVDILQNNPDVGLDRLRGVANRFALDQNNQVLQRITSLEGWALLSIDVEAAIIKLQQVEQLIGTGVQSETWVINNRHWLALAMLRVGLVDQAERYAQLAVDGHAQTSITLPWEEGYSKLLLQHIREVAATDTDQQVIQDAIKLLQDALPASHPNLHLVMGWFPPKSVVN